MSHIELYRRIRHVAFVDTSDASILNTPIHGKVIQQTSGPVDTWTYDGRCTDTRTCMHGSMVRRLVDLSIH